jgi:ketosteroid isomerase-like protein
MHRSLVGAAALFAAAAVPLGVSAADAFDPETVIALERKALDRWGNGDPGGYLELYAQNATYFDPQRERQIDGLDALKAAFEPIKGLIKTERYEIIGPKVYHDGNIAVLSFNLVTYGFPAGGTQTRTAWNVTSAYALIAGQWKIVHEHFSITNPQGN